MCAAAALTFGAPYLRRPAEERHVFKLQIQPPAKSELISSPPAISPDGRRITFVAVTEGDHRLWVRDLDSLESRLLPGAAGAGLPFWSPDSRTIGFFAGGYLKKIDAAGGPASSLCDAPGGHGGTWNRNGVIVFSPGFGTALFRVSSSGGKSVPLTTIDQAGGEAANIYPWFLPDGRHVLYLAVNTDRAKQGIRIADLDSTERRRILPSISNAAYAPPGFLVFARERTLMAMPFDAATAQATGEAFPIAENADNYFSSSNSRALFSVSSNGVLVYTTGGLVGGIQLIWFDRSGKQVGTVGPPGQVNWPSISPDEKTVAVTRDDPQNGASDVWLYDLARGSSSRLTSHPKGSSMFPLWSPDGGYVGYSTDWDGERKLYRKAASGAGAEEVLYAPRPGIRADDWSRDGRYLVGEQGNAAGGGNLWVFPLFGDRKQYQFLRSEFYESRARISPDSRWLDYTSDRTGRYEVYITSFPTAGAQTQVSTGGGVSPVWSRDGKELFYLANPRQVMAVAIRAGSHIEAGIPKLLFEANFA